MSIFIGYIGDTHLYTPKYRPEKMVQISLEKSVSPLQKLAFEKSR